MEKDSSASQTGWVIGMDKVFVFILNKNTNDYGVIHGGRSPFRFETLSTGGTII